MLMPVLNNVLIYLDLGYVSGPHIVKNLSQISRLYVNRKGYV